MLVTPTCKHCHHSRMRNHATTIWQCLYPDLVVLDNFIREYVQTYEHVLIGESVLLNDSATETRHNILEKCFKFLDMLYLPFFY